MNRIIVILSLVKIGLNDANPEANDANLSLSERIVAALRDNPKISKVGFATKLDVFRATIQLAVGTLVKNNKAKRETRPTACWP